MFSGWNLKASRWFQLRSGLATWKKWLRNDFSPFREKNQSLKQQQQQALGNTWCIFPITISIHMLFVIENFSFLLPHVDGWKSRKTSEQRQPNQMAKAKAREKSNNVMEKLAFAIFYLTSNHATCWCYGKEMQNERELGEKIDFRSDTPFVEKHNRKKLFGSFRGAYFAVGSFVTKLRTVFTVNASLVPMKNMKIESEWWKKDLF